MAQKERDFIKRALAEAQRAVRLGEHRVERLRAQGERPAVPSHDMHRAAAMATGQAMGFDGPGTGDPDLDWIIKKESSGKVTAKNPRSSAFGLGQLIKANRERFAKQLGLSSPDTTDYNEQLQMMRAYITERYGSPRAARKFWERNGWY